MQTKTQSKSGAAMSAQTTTAFKPLFEGSQDMICVPCLTEAESDNVSYFDGTWKCPSGSPCVNAKDANGDFIHPEA